MKLYNVDFAPMWPVPCGLIIAAESLEQAFDIAKETIKHTKIDLDDVREIDTSEAGVIFYESGDY